MRAFVLIADIIKSREIDDRNQFQLKLNSELQKINQNSKKLLSPYTITLGDEFQAVYDLEFSLNLLKDIFIILLKVYPLKIRIAIGYADIVTEINKEKAIGMDGPAFYDAREGINVLKDHNSSIIQFYGELKERELINSSLKLSMSLMANWKRNTLFIFNELLNNSSVKDIIPKLDISERGVYKIINTNNLRDFVEYFSSIGEAVKHDK